jgi:hypothetical protein
VATFYAARSEIITPLPWLTFALPFSVVVGRTNPLEPATRDQILKRDAQVCPVGTASVTQSLHDFTR